MRKNVILLVLFAFMSTACAKQLPPLEPAEVQGVQNKSIYVHAKLKSADIKKKNEALKKNAVLSTILKFEAIRWKVGQKVEDYLLKKGWNVLDVHRLVTPEENRKFWAKYGVDNTNIKQIQAFMKSKENRLKILFDTDNWRDKDVLQADYILTWFVLPKRDNKQELVITVTLYKMLPQPLRMEKARKQASTFFPLLAEKAVSIKKELLYTEDKIVDYTASAIITALKDYL